MERDDLTGRRFNRLVVLGFSHKSKYGELIWKCRCDCGTEKLIKAGPLRRGRTQSCGCFHRDVITTHGMTKTRTFKSWESMLQRCTNPNAPDYAHYGGRGVKVCDRWLESFSNFLDDMGERPEGKSLDRIRVNGDYEPSNCQWSDKYQQQRNRRATATIAFGADRLTAAEWAERTGLPAAVIRWRLKRGWSVERALSEPVTPGRGKPSHKD